MTIRSIDPSEPVTCRSYSPDRTYGCTSLASNGQCYRSNDNCAHARRLNDNVTGETSEAAGGLAERVELQVF
jgi:hypothetical protein